MNGLLMNKIVKIILILDISLCGLCNHVIDKCKEQCDTLTENSNDSSWACDSSCRVQQCDNGCLLWQSGVTSTCQDSCDETQITNKEVQHCIAGCNLAVDIYAQEVKDALNSLSRPGLVFGSQTNESVILEWSYTSHSHEYNISLRLQMRIPGLATDWQDHDNIQWMNDSRRVKVKGLRPYTVYQFRIVAEIVNGRHFKTSNSSANIQTMPFGVPDEAPTIVNMAAGSTYIHMKLQPPFYTNDKAVSYEIQMTAYYPTTAELPTVIASLHGGIYRLSVLVKHDTTVVTRLQPDTEYKVEVKLRNMIGVGPSVTSYVRTLPEKTVSSPVSTKFLIYGADNMVLKQPVGAINVKPDILFQARQPGNNVTGVAFHYREDLVFVAVASGVVYSLSKQSGEYVEREIYFSNDEPRALDVDWLNNRLYIAEDNKILTCSLDGECKLAVDNLDSRPEDIKVDPGSGYLFWVQFGHGRGIYRRELTDLGQTESTSLKDPRIIDNDLVLAIAIDHANYRLFYSNPETNTMMSDNFDGSDAADIRLNVQSRAFGMVSSMAFYDDLFVWSNGGSMHCESQNEHGKYFHNKIVTVEDIFTGLNIWHANSQPYPVPYLPPIKVQALFSDKVAQLTWEPPSTGQGRGAWNTWYYEVEVINLATGHNHTFGKLLQLNLSVTNVVPETSYSFRVRAFSAVDKGPWSKPFVGSTLKREISSGELIVVDSENAVYTMTLSGDNQRLSDQYLGFEALKKFELQQENMLWSSEEGHLFHSQGVSPVSDLANIHIFAYDWIGNTLYWAPTKPPKNMIKRLLLEPVADNYPETIVQDAMGFSVEGIVIDAVEGYVYFSTHLSVEAARLDGLDYTTVHREDYYMGKYVLGLALDYDTNSIYWLLKTTETVLLYKAPLFTLWPPTQTESSGMEPQEAQVMFSFKTQSLPVMLEFYSNKLFWKSDTAPELEILDIQSESLSRMPLRLTGEKVRAFVVNYPTKYKYPDGENRTTSIDVLPTEVFAPSIKRRGRWDKFDITWAPSSVGYGQVYYEVVLQDKHPIEKHAAEPHLSYINEFKPYTLLTVIIKACTSWRCSKAIGTSFYTPMAVPSKPGRPRGYVTHHETLNFSAKKIKVEFHWDTPDPPNGIITVYNVKSSLRENGPFLYSTVTGQQNYYDVPNTKNNTVYYFSVQACTEAGCSSYTPTISVNATEPKPVPKLLTMSENSANLFLPVEKKSQMVVNDDICSLTYIAREDTYFWINKKGTIVKQDAEGEKELVRTNNTTGKSLTVDWVGRDLYWSAQSNKHTADILKYDLNKAEGSKPIIVMSRIQVVWKLDISPYKSSLYWTETTAHGYADLYTSDLQGANPKSFFLNYKDRFDPDDNRVRRQACSCAGIRLSPVFIIDHSEGRDAELYFAEAATPNIWAAELDGCHCRLVLNGTEVAGNQSLDLPPDSMTIDQERLYWSSSHSSNLQSVSKWTGDKLDSVRQGTASLKDIKAVGNHLQPMPDTKCLLINSYEEKPRLLHSTNTSLQLSLHPWMPSEDCATISAPTVKYLLHYKPITEGQTPMPCDGLGVTCDAQESYELESELTGLKPHTNYLIQVAATNYYMESRQRRAIYAEHDIYTTSNGVPSAPREFSAIAATPTQVNLTWRSPSYPNAPYDQLKYKLEFHYKSDSTDKHSQRPIEGTPYEGQGNGMTYGYAVTRLQPMTKYFFRITVHSASSADSSPSEEVAVTTFQYPALVSMINRTESSVATSWLSPNDSSVDNHKIEYAVKNEAGFWEWQTNASEVQKTLGNTLYIQEFTGLEAYTHYAFRVQVVYKSGDHFIWPKVVFKTFRTKATIPSAPGIPEISSQGRLTILKWGAPSDGGVPILYYTLYVKSVSDPDWTEVHNATENRWIIEGLTEGDKYAFAVAAVNSRGAGDSSANSTVYVYVPSPAALHSDASEKLPVILSTCFGVIFLLVVVVIFLLLWKRYKYPKAKQFGLVNGFRRPDMELATLRDMPRVAMTSNALYAINIIPTDEGIAALPHYHREELTLTKFLGSGAFGEVYEGTAQNILSSDSGETKVAVKALKKGATDNEKEEFLKEALLMSNFKHSHILSLLGVCLHNDPQFIILELMEGGDLLTYLRSSRPSRMRHGCLQLSDMVCMSVDIAKGCQYLEQLHFVHRDLAARNCLVNNCDDPQLQRIVKIGDFGLARDIYKNDYYRKEGEGLMPVRWMSPESLVDGVFTTNSDVWAFGVLMWEVLSLGQQPYPARTNLDVLNFVRRGGRLDRPDNCPDDMYELMLSCWSFNAEMRPSFHTVLETLENFKEKSLNLNSDFYNKRPTSSGALSVKIPASDEGKRSDIDKHKTKNLKSNNVKRSFSFDVKGRFGIHPSSSKSHTNHQQQPEEGSGYLEPLVPSVENKYLELLSETDASCAKCGRIGCDERCHRGLLRHSSDCSHSLQRRLDQKAKEDESSSAAATNLLGTGKLGKKGKGKGNKSKKCDNSSSRYPKASVHDGNSSQGSENEDCTTKTKTSNGSRYHNVVPQENLWKSGFSGGVGSYDIGDDEHYSPGGGSSHGNSHRNSSGSVPGFLIHPHNVKRCSILSDDTSSVQSLSLPPDFDELAPNNRSSVDSNSPLLMWGPSTKNKDKSKSSLNRNSGLYQNGPSSGVKKYTLDDMEYLRKAAASPMYNLENSAESLV